MGRVYGWMLALSLLAVGFIAGNLISPPAEAPLPPPPSSYPSAVITIPAEQSPVRSQTVDARTLGQTFVQIAKDVNPAVVSLSSIRLVEHPPVEKEDGQLDDLFRGPFERFFNAPDEVPRQSLGSGVIVDGTNGYILTNQHMEMMNWVP